MQYLQTVCQAFIYALLFRMIYILYLNIKERELMNHQKYTFGHVVRDLYTHYLNLIHILRGSYINVVNVLISCIVLYVRQPSYILYQKWYVINVALFESINWFYV